MSLDEVKDMLKPKPTIDLERVKEKYKELVWNSYDAGDAQRLCDKAIDETAALYEGENEQLKQKITKLTEEVERLKGLFDRYATSARAIALWLYEFCDESKDYDEMISDASRKAKQQLDALKSENEELRGKISSRLDYECERDKIILEQQATIDKLKEENERLRSGEWISVKDRMPNEKEDVIWWCKFHDTKWFPVAGWIKYYTDGSHLIITPTNQTEYKKDSDKRKVTHWMPLPQPPQQD